MKKLVDSGDDQKSVAALAAKEAAKKAIISLIGSGFFSRGYNSMNRDHKSTKNSVKSKVIMIFNYSIGENAKAYSDFHCITTAMENLDIEDFLAQNGKEFDIVDVFHVNSLIYLPGSWYETLQSQEKIYASAIMPVSVAPAPAPVLTSPAVPPKEKKSEEKTSALEGEIKEIRASIKPKRQHIFEAYLQIKDTVTKRWRILENKSIQPPPSDAQTPLDKKLLAMYEVLKNISIQECWGRLSDSSAMLFGYSTEAQLKNEHKAVTVLQSTTLDTIGLTMISNHPSDTFAKALSNLTQTESRQADPSLFEKYFNRLTEILSQSIRKSTGGTMIFRSEEVNNFCLKLLQILNEAKEATTTPQYRR